MGQIYQEGYSSINCPICSKFESVKVKHLKVENNNSACSLTCFKLSNFQSLRVSFCRLSKFSKFEGLTQQTYRETATDSALDIDYD